MLLPCHRGWHGMAADDGKLTRLWDLMPDVLVSGTRFVLWMCRPHALVATRESAVSRETGTNTCAVGMLQPDHEVPSSFGANRRGIQRLLPWPPRLLVAGRHRRGSLAEHPGRDSRIPVSCQTTGEPAEPERSADSGVAHAEGPGIRSFARRQCARKSRVSGRQARQAHRHDRRRPGS